MLTRRRVLLGALLMALAATVVSLTIGRDLFAGRSPDLASFAIVNFAGYLFFIVMPVEILVPWYLAESHAAVPLGLLAVGTAGAAQMIDYGIGRLVSGPVVEGLIGERRLTRMRGHIEQWGPLAIFFFNLTPLSSPIMLAAAGVVRFGFLKAMAWSVTGLAGKYAAMIWLFS